MLPKYPSLFQVNTRVLIGELSVAGERLATLDDISDQQMELWKQQGFDLIWFLGAWQTGPAAQKVSASKPEWLEEYRAVLPDFQLSDVCGSCFAIRDHRVHDYLGEISNVDPICIGKPHGGAFVPIQSSSTLSVLGRSADVCS
jgi:hypothetical protein